MNRPLKPTVTLPAAQVAPVPLAASPRAQVFDIEDPMIGKRLGFFELRARLGQGEHGTVYLADDLSLAQPVALKIGRRALQRQGASVPAVDLVAAARQQAKVFHQNVARVHYAAGGSPEDARPFVVTEYVDGHTLKEALARDGAMSWEDAVAVMVEVVRALDAAGAAGVHHGGLTSSNIMLQDHGTTDSPALKVVDFGVIAAHEDSPYVAPEQAGGAPATMRGDMFALGVLFHEMLTGSPPRAEAPLPEGAAPAYIRRLVAFLIRPEAKYRPSGYEELLGRLEVALVKPAKTAPLPALARATAFAIDLVCLAGGAAGLAVLLPTMGAGSAWEGAQLGLVLFSVYWIAAHKVKRQSLGKYLCGVALQKARAGLGWSRVAVRYVIQFWGPIAATLLIDAELGSGATAAQIATRLGSSLVVLGVLWLASFVVVLTDRKGLALHDHATETSVAAV